MKAYLLDTCVLSESTKDRPNRGVIHWMNSQTDDALFVSVLTLGEIQKGVIKMPPSRRKEKFQEWLDRDLRMRFAGRTLAITDQIATRWGIMQGEAEGNGILLPIVDSLLAATALVRDFIVVTRNTHDIERCGVQTINPWT
ncbi:MAG: type II toxin-antitoxin system VapC family toxin [Candidatus Sumerlaeota bacterium]|nr:type II toxin-antitoxin system VapC family toxin [Candidatus Sumerlaeota bacterium]